MKLRVCSEALVMPSSTGVIVAGRPPLASILTVFPSNNDHKFYSLLAHLSVGLFGEAPWSLRLPSVLFAVATIPMLYVFGKQSTGRLEALLAAALLKANLGTRVVTIDWGSFDTHGGQVALPFYGAMLTMSRYDKKYEAGRYEVGKTTLYVNRGIGFEPHFARVRFASRPELTIIDIVGTASE